MSGNYILCPECFEKEPGPREEKSCAHGLAVGIKCVKCGHVKGRGFPAWTCLGTMKDAE